tara:strand:- start:624 stop:1067 length:444 start_codon:yes stop_codon:yes gene_type:complete
MISILLLAFGLNVLAPSGYMIGAADGGFPTISVCPETHPLARAVAASRERHEMHGDMAMDHAAMDHASMDHAAMGHGDDGDTSPSASSTRHCELAGVAKIALHCVDADLLAGEMAYAVLLGLKAIAPIALPAQPYLRPPLRGPPPAI